MATYAVDAICQFCGHRFVRHRALEPHRCDVFGLGCPCKDFVPKDFVPYVPQQGDPPVPLPPMPYEYIVYTDGDEPRILVQPTVVLAVTAEQAKIHAARAIPASAAADLSNVSVLVRPWVASQRL